MPLQYSPEWDLTSIPDSIFASERARRIAAKRKKFGPLKLEPCATCGRILGARDRRHPCPIHNAPAPRNTPWRVKKSRNHVMLALALAINEVKPPGPGTWHVRGTGRRDLALTYEVSEEALRALIPAIPSEGGDEILGEFVWLHLGGADILACARVPGEYKKGSFRWGDGDQMNFWAAIPCGG